MCVYMRIGIPGAIFTNMQEAVDKRYVRKPGKRQEMIRDLEQMGASNYQDDKTHGKGMISINYQDDKMHGKGMINELPR